MKKILRIGLIIVLLITPASAVIISQKLYAVDAIKNATITKVDDAIKDKIIADKNKIDEERNAILADSKKLQDAKKTGDKAKIEQVKQEIDQDIERRKAVIRSLKEDIRKKEDMPGTLEPSRKHGKIKR